MDVVNGETEQVVVELFEDSTENQEEQEQGANEDEPPKKRGRGRPPKSKNTTPNILNKTQESLTLSPQPHNAPSGRPKRQVTPKVDSNYVYANNAGSSNSSPTKEEQSKVVKNGMKRKIKAEPEDNDYEVHETSEIIESNEIDQDQIVHVKLLQENDEEQPVNNEHSVEDEQIEQIETSEANLVDNNETNIETGQKDDFPLSDKNVSFPDGYLPTDDKRKPKKVYMKDPSDPARRFRCPYDGCSYVAKYRSNLWDHKKTHTGEKPYQCTWPDCSMRFSQTHQLKLHTRSHTGERPYKCDFRGCDAAFSQKPGLRSHALTHTGEKNFVCDYPGCNWAFRLKGALTDHKRAIHEDKKNFMCEWPGCGKRFLQSCHLKKHIMAHADVKPYACDWPKCTYKAVTMAYVTNHRRTHTGERNHECNFPGCNKKFVKSSHVNRHRQRCHPGMFRMNGDGEFVEQNEGVFIDAEEGDYTIEQEMQQEIVQNDDTENVAENEQIVIEYSEQEHEIIIQSGNTQKIYQGQLVEDKDGSQYIFADGHMIPLQDIINEETLKDDNIQEVYLKEDVPEEQDPQPV